jgi:putative membrane protein
MLAVFPVKQLRAVIPVLVVALLGARDDLQWQLVTAVGAPSALVGFGVLRWLTVRYRVSAERVELRSGLLNRQHRSVRRDRVRTVDLTATLVHRVFGLSVLEIGTGSQSGSEGRLSLNAVSSREAERLRRELLDRSPVAVTNATSPGTARSDPARSETARSGTAGSDIARSGTARSDATSPAPGQVLARLRPSWLRFAPLTMSGLVAVLAVLGAASRIADDFGVRWSDLAGVQQAGARLSAEPLWIAVATVAAAALLTGALGSVAIYLESWWGYRLTREADDTLLLRRGLLTTRSLSIEQRRMRGAEVTQSLLLRAFRGARCAAVTTGLDAKASMGGALLPPAPVAEAHRVASAALRLPDASEATAAPLRRHPAAARRRRLTRALAPTGVLVAAAWWGAPLLGWPALRSPALWVLLPAAALVGLDRHRNLGHALTSDYLVIGQGSLVRRKVALQRRGIIGWRLRQSLFQRRAGLVTLDAVSAAGRRRYSVVDLPMAWAVRLVDEVNPGLLPLTELPS